MDTLAIKSAQALKHLDFWRGDSFTVDCLKDVCDNPGCGMLLVIALTSRSVSHDS